LKTSLLYVFQIFTSCWRNVELWFNYFFMFLVNCKPVDGIHIILNILKSINKMFVGCLEIFLLTDWNKFEGFDIFFWYNKFRISDLFFHRLFSIEKGSTLLSIFFVLLRNSDLSFVCPNHGKKERKKAFVNTFARKSRQTKKSKTFVFFVLSKKIGNKETSFVWRSDSLVVLLLWMHQACILFH
jgi:hypothetical protein